MTATDLLRWLEAAWPYLLTGLSVLVALVATGHAVLYRRDSRAALLWVGLIWLTPLFGSLLYFMFGINRIRRRARSLRGEPGLRQQQPCAAAVNPATLRDLLPRRARHLAALDELVESVTVRPLVPGNRIEPLRDGDQAYPAMLAAIDGASASISLASYIFASDHVGRRFVDRLAAARQRGVQVRVLVDDAGAHYSWPRITRLLRRARIESARFHPRFRLLPRSVLNLRNHRKICVVDGRVAFTGGMNIRRGNVLAEASRYPTRDVHFRVEGPVVAQLQEVFAEDWAFTTGERLEGEAWFPVLEEAGAVMARGIADGPDEDFEKLRWSILGALGIARRSVKIVTPYFLPDAALVSALSVAALRGVEVDILLPARGNLRLVQWAMHAMLWQVLERGCRVWFTPPPFDHTKLMLIDGHCALFGSANWDPRSLRLNFELNVEAYGSGLLEALEGIFEEKRASARRVTLEEMDGRSLPRRLRDGVARLFAPVL